METKALNPCPWPANDQLMQTYHDTEWCTSLHDDQKLFELLVLETFQAGLSWRTILHKREAFRQAFLDYDVNGVSQMQEQDVEQLMQNAGIVRNRLKIKAAITNAEKYLEIQKIFGSFDAYFWQFVNGVPIVNDYKCASEVPAKTHLSDAISKDLKARGFKFVGSTIVYAFMQAAGLVNDHLVGCPAR